MDCEIDRVLSAVLSKLRLDGDRLDCKGKKKSDGTTVLVVQALAIAEARESCNLKYLVISPSFLFLCYFNRSIASGQRHW